MQGFLRMISSLCLLAYTSIVSAGAEPPDLNQTWNSRLKNFYFQERPIQENTSVVSLTAPDRAEDPARVPVSITTRPKDLDISKLKSLYLIIDNNPSPLAGKFNLSPNSHIAQLDLFIRVNEYSPVRVIAETSDGQLYMQSHFVKASGGCSAPAATDMQKAAKELGQMRFKINNLTKKSTNDWAQASLAIKHPNLTGLQRDQLTQLFVPAHYIKAIEVKLGDDIILSAETDISISENPVLSFDFKPHTQQQLTATITDTEGKVFVHQQMIGEDKSASY